MVFATSSLGYCAVAEGFLQFEVFHFQLISFVVCRKEYSLCAVGLHCSQPTCGRIDVSGVSDVISCIVCTGKLPTSSFSVNKMYEHVTKLNHIVKVTPNSYTVILFLVWVVIHQTNVDCTSVSLPAEIVGSTYYVRCHRTLSNR